MSARGQEQHDIAQWREPSRTFSACTGGPCDQGRRLCPSPDACQQPDYEDDGKASWVGAIVAVGVAAVVLGIGMLAVFA